MVMAWFEDEGFWAATYPIIFPDERFVVAEEQVDKILKLVGFQPGAVLDLACGPGRHAVALARQGIKVTAVDLTEFLLCKARERASQAGVEVEFVREDMRRFVRPGAFDVALSMFSSFGYFGDRREDLLVLQNLRESLKSGGACLIDVPGKEMLGRQAHSARVVEQPNGVLFVEWSEILDDWTRVRTQWILIEGGQARAFSLELTVYSGQEIKDLLVRAEFAEVTLFGDLDGSPYGPHADRLIALGRKAA
jgi:SAM-dependent methyltransferase